MFRFVFKRLILMIPMLLAIILVVQFLLVSITAQTGSSFSAYGYDDALEDFYTDHEIPDNFISQYVRYVYNLFVKGELSHSSKTGAFSFQTNLEQRSKQTLLLTGLGLLFTALVGVPLGIISATHKDGPIDRIISTVSMVFASIPSYVLTIILVFVFAVAMKLLPVFGISEPGAYIMPTVVLGIGGVSLMIRMTRSAISDVLSRQYITTLYAKGLSKRKIIFGHVLRNALVPIIATMNNVVVQMFCSTLIVENFYAIPGLGAFLVEAVLSRDIQAVLACVVIIAIVLMVTGLICETLQLIADPVARREARKRGGRRKLSGGKKHE